MGFATLIFAGRDWLLPAVLVLAAATGLIFWNYRGSPLTGWLRLACQMFKLAGLLLLGFCLLEPLWSGQRARRGANQVLVLADNSRSLQIKDAGAVHSRGENLKELLNDPQKSRWLGRVEEDFQLRRYLFDRQLQYTRDFSELQFDGRATALLAALHGAAERHHGQPLAGIVLLTDGNATDLDEGLPDLQGLPPVYPVVLGTDEALHDLAVGKLSVSQTSFEDAPVTVQAEVTSTGFSGQRVLAELREVAHSKSTLRTKSPMATNAPAAYTQTLRAGYDDEPLGFSFQVRPPPGQITFYELRVSAESESGVFIHPERSSEATLANNVRTVVVDRGQEPMRVLYISGRPNWEFKFLNRAIAEDPQVELTALIRLAKREGKFEFKGRAGETSNPLFRGFDKKSEDTERYDQPVLVALNTRDETELRDGFPKVPEQLYDYQALILDDLEADFFTPDQQALVQKFVAERGGGFLMLGGQESFHEGNFDRTPIGAMLPVYLDHGPQAVAPGNLRLNLTREGWLQPWVRVKETETAEKQRLEGMPEFLVINRVRGIKPGATVLATVKDEGGQTLPALAVQRFGRGRSSAMMLGDFWHWGFRDENKRQDFDKAWRQMVRWLVSDVPTRIELTATPRRDDPQSAVRLQVRARDKKFLPLDNATVALTVRPMGAGPEETNAVIKLTAEAGGEPGVYEATYVPRHEGGYLAEATVTDMQGVVAGHASAAWANDFSAEEFRSLKPNRSLLETIAARTGGQVLRPDQLDDFAASLPKRSAPVQEAWNYPLWHSPWIFLLAITCLVAEWGIRRWRGIA